MPIYKVPQSPVIYHQHSEKMQTTITVSSPLPPASPPPTLEYSDTELPEADRGQESIITREIREQREKERIWAGDGTLKRYNGYPEVEEESDDSHSEVTPSVIQKDIEQLKAKEDEYYRQRERIESEKTMLSPVNKQESPRSLQKDHNEKITMYETPSASEEVFTVNKIDDSSHMDDSGYVVESGFESTPSRRIVPSTDESVLESSPPQQMPSYIEVITHPGANKAESLIAKEIRELEEREAELRSLHREMTPRSDDDRSSQTAPANFYDKPVHSQTTPVAYSQPAGSVAESPRSDQETIFHTSSHDTHEKVGSTTTGRSPSVEIEMNKDKVEPVKKQSQPMIRRYSTEPVPLSAKKTTPSFSSTRYADTNNYRSTFPPRKTGTVDMIPIEPEKASDDADGYAESIDGSTLSEPISVQPPYEPVDEDFPFVTLQSNPVEREMQSHQKRVDEENDVRKQVGLPLLESLVGAQTFSEVATTVKTLKEWKRKVDEKKASGDLKGHQRQKRLSTYRLQQEIEVETNRGREVEKQHEQRRHQPPVKTEQGKTDEKSPKAAEKVHESSPDKAPQKDSKTTKPTQNGELVTNTQVTSPKSNKSTAPVTSPQPSKAEPEVSRRYSEVAMSHDTVYRKPRLSASQLMELEMEELKRREAEYEEIRKQRESVSDNLSQNGQDEIEQDPGSPRLPITPPPDSPRSQPYGGSTQKRDDTWDKMLI